MIATAASRLTTGDIAQSAWSWIGNLGRRACANARPAQPAAIVRQTRDASAVNAIINHPSIFPSLSLGMEGPLDIAPLMENPRNLCFLGEHGGAILVWSAPGVYDAHDFILPEGRGKWAKLACTAILSAAFNAHDARMVWAQTPVGNRPCRFFNRALGFKSEGVEQVVFNPDIGPQAVELFVMEAVCL